MRFAAMHSFDVPDFIQTPSGVPLLDALPTLSLFACVPTLQLFRKTRRYTDLAMFAFGFALAAVYHVGQAQGLEASRYFGVAGVYWRSFDVLWCLILLTRTVGHIFGATRLPYSALPNIVFPVGLITAYLNVERLEMAALVILSSAAMLTTGLSVHLCQAKASATTYRPRQGRSVFSCFYIGLFFFFLPNFFGRYWLFHSLWHLFLAAGYYLLYSELERATLCPSPKNGKVS